MQSPTKIVRVLNGETVSPPPIWLMRQAGRYLPEYRALRRQASSFLGFCYTPKLVVEATLQPIRRFGFDAAIIFGDILVVPDAFEQKVSFEAGNGPKLQPISGAADMCGLRESIDITRLSPVFEAITLVKQALPETVSLIGFCGAPFTLASYMIAGQATPDQAPARLLAYRDPELFQALIQRLVTGSIDYLLGQIEAGVDIIQIFDSWAGALAGDEFKRWCVAPLRAIIAGVRARHPGIKIIAFPRRAGLALRNFAGQTGADALGLDETVDPFAAAKLIAPSIVFQGNLDPLALVAGGRPLREATERILSAFAGRPHVFNLGHGILPETHIGHVESLLAHLRSGG